MEQAPEGGPSRIELAEALGASVVIPVRDAADGLSAYMRRQLSRRGIPQWDPRTSEHTMLVEKIEQDADMAQAVPAIVEKMKAQYQRGGLDISDRFGIHFVITDWSAEYPDADQKFDGFVITAEVRWRSLP